MTTELPLSVITTKGLDTNLMRHIIEINEYKQKDMPQPVSVINFGDASFRRRTNNREH